MPELDYLFVSNDVVVSEETIVGLSSGDVLGVVVETDSGEMATPSDVLSIFEEVKSKQMRPRWRIFLLYPDDTIRYRFPDEDIVSGGSYTETYQTGQRRSMSFSLYNETGKYSPGINSIWLDSRLRLDMGMEFPDGTTVWLQRGIYVISSVGETVESGKRTVSISAADKWTLFSGATGSLEDTYEIPPESDLCSIIQSILLTNNEAGYPLDSRPPRIHHSLFGKKSQATISENAGSSYASLLQAIATQLSADIFYNARGELVVTPLDETMGDDWKPVLFDFNGEDGDFGSLSFSFDSSEVKNRVIVIGSTTSGNYSRAVASNDNPSSPTSVGRIGVRTAPIINDSNISSDQLAKERAAYELRKILLLKTKTTLEVAYNPLLTVNNLITITSDKPEMTKQRFLLQSVSCSLDYNGSMSISFSNINNLPFLVKTKEFQDIISEA